ncbi:uncharacterized protein LOC142181032 [Nicotiana tabacum]|uniref:Uncharacterized protein LOC142181032 n=1 Tax=Nicotiana tabacum TaxID=4097 RepID=A0AC58UIC2_TOBAC
MAFVWNSVMAVIATGMGTLALEGNTATSNSTGAFGDPNATSIGVGVFAGGGATMGIDEVFEVTVMYNMVQQLTLRLFHTESHVEFVLTLIYAKCDAIERIELWDSLYAMARDMDASWLVGGDFNVIWDEEEKFGGLPVSLNEIDDFRHCINTCNLFDLGFKGSIFTWWNGRAEEDCIFKRLDRCLANVEFQQTFPGIEVQHLSKTGSDHSPMYLKCDIETPPIKKPFKFLNFWVEHATFKDVVKENWSADFSANPFILFNHKLKKLKKALSLWSKATFGDIFQKIASMEEVVMVHEAEFEANPTGMNRERLQKIEEEQEIAEEAIKFYEEQFTEAATPASFDIVEHVPNLINTEQNAELIKQPTKQEVKMAVLGLNGDSAGGPDGDDLYDMVRAFFSGHELPKCVISSVVHERLVKFLPSLISEEQAGFVKGRNIVENILLTQEIVTDIRLRTKVGPNVILKLDMTKAYDRISWLFLTKVLRKMGFTERLIGIVFGLVSNNWYSILINGQAHGFFKSSRGIKQGDLVSPTLFILAAEALSRGLNALHTNLYFCGFGMPKWSPKINHLAYADDMIIFSSSDETSLMLIMQVLKAYENESGQLVNKTKSAMYLHHLTDMEVVSKVERITGIDRNDFPIIYLGCPIFYARRKLEFYQPLITKVMDKLQSWQGKLLSVGGRAVLISHVLQSMPMHLLSVVNPPKYVINRLHKLFAQFLWSSTVGGTSRHWASWNTLCMPVEEGGIGFRSLHDVTKALFRKLSCNFRTKPSLWSSFVCQKYCKKLNPIIVPWKRGSHVWRKMLECRNLIEHQILWQTKMGSSLFWYENWTGLGPLYFLVPQDFGIDENVHNVHDVTLDGEWDVDRLFEMLPEELAVHILEKIKPPSTMRVLDKPFWMLETRGYFSVKSAWEYTRRRDEPRKTCRMIWIRNCKDNLEVFSIEGRNRCGGLTLHQAITKCWTANVCLRLKPVMQALPSCVVWELWKRRNSMKYGEAVTTSRVIYQVSSNLQALVKVRKPGMDMVPHKWQDLLAMMENFTPKLKVTKVMWEFPSA